MPARSPAFLFAISTLAAACGEVTSTAQPDGGGDPDAPPAVALGITAEHAALTAPPGIGVELDVTIARNGAAGDVTVALAGTPPGGVTAAPLTIPDGASTGTLVLTVADGAAQAISTLVLEASAATATPGQTELALTIDAATPAFELSWATLGGAAPPLTSRAAWTVPGWTSPLAVYGAASGGYTGTLTLRWSDLPAGVSGAAATMSAPLARTAAPLAADSTAVATTGTVRLIGSDGTFRQELTLALTVGKAPAIDPAIGAAGRVVLDEATAVTARAVDVNSTLQPLVFARRGDGRASVTRLTAAGAVDTTFGTAGTATVSGLELYTGDVGPSDRAYLVGTGAGAGITVARLTTSGALDTQFDGDGVVDVVTGHASDEPVAVRVRNSGTLVIAGASGGRAQLLQLTAAGALDPAFGSGGVAALTTAGTSFSDFTFDGQGRIVATGTIDAGEPRALVARFTAAGVLDTSFGTGGLVTLDPPDADATTAAAIVEASNGDLLVGGATRDAASGRWRGLLARLDATGTPSSGFGTAGVRTVELSSGPLGAVRLSQLRYTAAGLTAFGTYTELDGSGEHPLLVRVDDTGALVPTFGTGGIDWLLGGEAGEAFAGARPTTGGIWIVGTSTPADAPVVMKAPPTT